MPIKKVAHRATIVKKGGNKMALKWVPSSFEESDLKKAKKDGFLPEAAPVISPATSAFPRRQKDIGLCSLPSFSVAFLSLPTSFFVGFYLSTACSYISSRRIQFSISPISLLFVSLFLESTHIGFFGNSFPPPPKHFFR
jgi:hypothetical protein